MRNRLFVEDRTHAVDESAVRKNALAQAACELPAPRASAASAAFAAPADASSSNSAVTALETIVRANRQILSRDPAGYSSVWRIYSTEAELWHLCEALDERGERYSTILYVLSNLSVLFRIVAVQCTVLYNIPLYSTVQY